MSVHRLTPIALVVFLGLAACGSSENGSPPDAGGGPSDAAGSGGLNPSANASNAAIGYFDVELVEPVEATTDMPATPGYTRVEAWVYDGVQPESLVWTEVAKEGACTLVTPRAPFCNQTCADGAVCVANDVCQTRPTSRSVGTVKITGLHSASGVTELSLAAPAESAQKKSYALDEALPFPAFAEGEDIVFEASGDFFPAFTLRSKGIGPLNILNSAITLESNNAVDLTWTAPAQAGLSRIHVEVNISVHGGTKGIVKCEGPDSGSLRIPAAVITRLLGLGTSGFPRIIVTRSALGSTTVSAGRIDLTVYSDVSIVVQVPGLVSCTGDEQCPTGKTCQPSLSMCK